MGLLATVLGAALPARAQLLEAREARMITLMKADSYNYVASRSPSVWSIHFTGKHLNDIHVILAVSDDKDDDLMVVFVTVAEKRRLPVNTDFMRKLLEENHTLDRVKIGYDADGDLFVRTDASLRTVDADEFRDIVDQVQKSADEVYGIVQPSLQ
ncbi:MAG TPA: YbjN domain-containing protein [Terracidiphilus sp.]|nr:YbjN domain-containing protein [Terracidiphilus sp.]